MASFRCDSANWLLMHGTNAKDADGRMLCYFSAARLTHKGTLGNLFG